MNRPLTRELAALLLIKAAALALLFVVFFGPAHRPKIDADATARALLSEQPASPKATP